MALDILVNTGSGNGFLPNGTKPLPEALLAYHHQGPEDNFAIDASSIKHWNYLENYLGILLKSKTSDMPFLIHEYNKERKAKNM